MNRVWAARIAFPAAFLAGVTIAVLLVRAGLADETASTVTRAVTRTVGPTTGATTTAPKPLFTRVQAGDTLDAIALAHNTTVERLLELNPVLDPTNLQIGQRVRVR